MSQLWLQMFKTQSFLFLLDASIIFPLFFPGGRRSMFDSSPVNFLNYLWLNQLISFSLTEKKSKKGKKNVDKMNQPVVFNSRVKSSGYTNERPRFVSLFIYLFINLY